MSTVIVIPARYASSRYPGKPLALLLGPDGVHKPLIQHTWQAARRVHGIDAVYIATDDERIAKVAKGFGAEVIMTSKTCRNGTERCAEAISNVGITPDVVVNLQGDAPLTPSWFVEDLVTELSLRKEFDVATPVLRHSAESLNDFVFDRSLNRIGGTTAVFANDGRALYFSKEKLPASSSSMKNSTGQTPVAFHHIGVYAYRPSALASYMRWGEGRLERAEGLEQLRFLENGESILCVEVEGRGEEVWEVNNPQDVVRVEAIWRAI